MNYSTTIRCEAWAVITTAFAPLRNSANYFWIDRTIAIKKLSGSLDFLSPESVVYLMCYIGIIHRASVLLSVITNLLKEKRRAANVFICVIGILFDSARLLFFFQGNEHKKDSRFCKEWNLHQDKHSGNYMQQECLKFHPRKQEDFHAVYLKHSDKNLLCMHGYITTDNFEDKFMFLGTAVYYAVLSSFYFG